ncbi:1334_t:CDS:1, partial [Gigaspora margarita]
KNDDEGSTSKEKNLKQEGELSLKIILESLADVYLEVLKNLILELIKSKEPEL